MLRQPRYVDDGCRLFPAVLSRTNIHRRYAQRGSFDPMYLAYTLGKLMFMELREKLRALHGDAFSLMAFHDAVLARGAPTVPVLESSLLART